MDHSMGWLLPSQSEHFARIPLLGRESREHVRQALLGAGIFVPDGAPGEAELRSANLLVMVRSDVPCLSADTLRGFAMSAHAHHEHPCVLLAADLSTPLAMAMTCEQYRSLPDSIDVVRPLDEIAEAFNIMNVPLKVWHDDSTDGYFPVVDALSYAAAFRLLRRAMISRHMENGVIVLDPEHTIIESDVFIGTGTLVYAGNTLQGSTRIGCDCVLYPNNRMQNATVGDHVTVESSVLLDCTVGSHTTVGPFAYLRPASQIGEHCRIGDFVEVKNSSIGDGTKVSHLTYVGDSDLGKDINLGCGVVFVNYDGKAKNRSRVEDHAFIGCNCNLVAPVHIGQNAYLAAGSTVTSDVPADALLVARSREVIKEDWVKRRKEQGKL